MAITNNIQLGRTQKVFAVKETTRGTIVAPATGNLLVLSGPGNFNQTPNYTNSSEVRDTRSVMDRFRDKFPAGQWNFPMFARPSGTAGAAPDGDVLFECALGTKTVVADTSVAYTLAKTLPSMSIYFGLEDMVYCAVGATVNELKLGMTNKGAVQFDFSGQFMELKKAGKCELASASGAVITLKAAGDYKKFSVGMRVKIYDVSESTWEDNSGAGYAITVVNSTDNKITLGTDPVGELTVADGDIIQGWLPTGTEVGDAIESVLGTVEFDSTAVDVTGAELTLSNNIKYLEDEITSTQYPSDYIADKRDVSCRTSMYMRTEDLHYFEDGKNNVEVAIDLLAGDTAGSLLTVALPQAVGSVPAISGDLEKMLDIDWTALATSSLEDELSITFT